MDNFVADAIFIDAEPHRVFTALLDPADLVVWMRAEHAEWSGEAGGSFLVRRSDGSELRGTIAACDPGARMELSPYHWTYDDVERGPMTVVFELTAHDGGLWFTVRQDGLDSPCDGCPDWRDFAQATRREWVAATVALKRHIEQI